MRLLNVDSMIIESFVGDVPPYAILSHTWGKNEVTFDDVKLFRSKQDFCSAMDQDKRAYAKIHQAARAARADGYSHIWIDSCCIDKSSSSELSEAINSMFAWYRQAGVCYSHLADFSLRSDRDIGRSRWFTRGWTLQELIAPREMVFVDVEWLPLGTKKSLRDDITAVTKIEGTVLDGESLEEVPAAARISWVAGRKTTRPEDIAYCLLGLLGVNMPLLYGEGRERAFLRLQEEFVKVSDDDSLFAWRASPDDAREKPYWGLLAPTPDYFARSEVYKKSNLLTLHDGNPTLVTNRGLRVEMALSPMLGDTSITIFLAILHCNARFATWDRPAAIFLQRLSGHENQYARVAADIILHPYMSVVNLPWDRLTESFQRLRGILHAERLVEPESKYLFVRQSPRQSGLVAGFYVDETTQLGDGDFLACVAERSQAWCKWGKIQETRWLAIDFKREYDRSELEIFESHRLDRRMTLGRMGVRLKCLDPSRSVRMRTETVYFAVGLEPLPENPIGTPAGFTRPWGAFLRGGTYGHIASSSVRIFDQTLEIDFTLGTRWASAFYKVELSLKTLAETP